MILAEMNNDVRTSPLGRVVYLEGDTDVEPFAALLGKPVGRPVLIDNVLVKGLSTRQGSGGSQVRFRVSVAQKFGLPGVSGILDGDGISSAAGLASFEGTGPLFTWPAYCIENMLFRGGWPPGWGPLDQAALAAYAPYVALNRLGARVRAHLTSLRIDRFQNPPAGEALLSVDQARTQLTAGRELLLGLDVTREYDEEVAAFVTATRDDIDEAHARLNGKWLLNHLAVSRAGRSIHQCRGLACEHVRSLGGAPIVKAFWSRLLGVSS